MSKYVYWHLPGFCVFKGLNTTIIDLMKEYPNCFHEGYRIGSVYGTFPGAIWNGGRTILGFTSKNDVQRIIKHYNSKNVPVRFTWTNSLIEEKHLTDTLCNLIMREADNGQNQVLVNTQILEDYLREKYPNFKFISSTTKRITSAEKLKEELDKDYFMVVLDYDLNHDEEVLKSLEPVAERVEILVDEICFPGCPKRLAHYRDESLKQLEYEIAAPFDCPNKQQTKSFSDCMARPAFISNTDIESYIDRGFENFKLVGRGLPQSLVIDSYVYYLAKPDKQDFIRDQIAKRLAALQAAAKAGQRR
ncbi:MAG: hypothetical protein II741_00335 [Lachnospiraceae bacterium]|nr:hypothetical protein [Lachnospiraceae bacterium]